MGASKKSAGGRRDEGPQVPIAEKAWVVMSRQAARGRDGKWHSGRGALVCVGTVAADRGALACVGAAAAE